MGMPMQENIDKFAKRLRLLYVEDDDFTRELMQTLLEEYFTHIVFASNGKEGLDYFTKHQQEIDIILTDINMPVMNGIEMIKHIRQIDAEIPILILTAFNDVEYLLEAIKYHINGYILKPIKLDQVDHEFSRIINNLYLKQKLKEQTNLLEQYQEIVDAGLIVSKTDPKGIIAYVNDNFCKISGYTREELIGKPHNIVRHPDMPKEVYADMWHTIKEQKRLWSGVIKNRKKDGGSYYVKAYVKPILDTNGNIIEYIALRIDITEMMSPQRQLQDCLAGTKWPVLLYMKLDEYHIVSELFDEKTLEEMQQRVAKLLSSHLPFAISKPKVFQMGNGEFASVLDSKEFFGNQEEVMGSLHQMIHSVKKEVIHFGEFVYDVSIVAALSYENEHLIENAKLGIEKLLREGGCLIVANNFVKEAQAQREKNMQTLVMIQKALDNNHIISYYQPIIDNHTQKIIKYESLVRLIDESGKVLSPFFFLDIAKKGRYYTYITKRVLQTSFDALRTLQEGISINLSALDIENSELNRYIIDLLEENKEYAKRITFELLEDESVKNFDVIKEFITKVKAYGVEIAIDDFGSGYSNYERLLEYQPDILKIDGSLIKNIQRDDYSFSIVKSIVGFAREQGFATVAEFVENEEIFRVLKELGIDYSQGYYFSPPKPLGEL